jgi:poly-gamma-glutamate synthesis protein (capsule biosynthesis protein)
MIDAGADVVVGTHVHVIQPEEWYREKPIFYGLGNFVFNGMIKEAERTGAYLEVDVTSRKVLGRRVLRVRLDRHGAPRWLDEPPVEPRQKVEEDGRR